VIEEELVSILELYGDITYFNFAKNLKGFFSGYGFVSRFATISNDPGQWRLNIIIEVLLSYYSHT
jgi:hypothetical protein